MIQINSNIIPKTKNAYLVGGSIRDVLLGLSPIDYDIAVLGNPEQFAKNIASKTSGRIIIMGKPGAASGGIIRVVSDDKIFDISSINDASIEDDLNQRDFTINAIAYSLSSGRIIDPLGGIQDLADKKIRMVSKQAFIKDPIRMIRAYRICALLNFKIDPQTVSAIKKDAKLIKNSAGERIRTELFKILLSYKAYYYLSQMANAGLLREILPELDALKGCMQNRYHSYDVFDHTMKAFCCLERILNNYSEYIPEIYNQNIKQLNKNKEYLLKFAILLHDIGKPAARSIDSQGNIHFYGHGKKGADMANKISKRLKLSTSERYYIDFIVRNHIRPLFLFISHQKKILTKKSITRFFIKCGDNTPALLLHTIADIQGKGNREDIKDAVFIEFAKAMLLRFFSDFMPEKIKPPLITGYDLIHEFGLTPSPLFKKILKIVQEERLSDKINTRQEALRLAKKILTNS
ncbi:MAG: CCA tRNA nucleotidyltransferase [Desulfobacteraceae bacterium]|uniref:CCA tRNA nucleotidyltransferase n=1 Tax=Candidatus Desulfaltia bathyphila TaxID=2841697 RepID=A0A8J6N6P7_9BACT|nr:CCA tRNA nucleotidyltransferase [Candidatus Desulfaltia bathyphila]MBL7195139.1 CCA tRNA nucleotidyltransferase [Desulfobacterales bacterium]